MPKFRKAMYVMLLSVISIFILVFLYQKYWDPGPSTNTQLNHKSQLEIVEILGVPDYEVTFLLESHMYEFRLGLISLFPDTSINNIFIRELTWESKRRTTKVWFYQESGEWKSVDNLSWNPNVVQF